LPKKLRTCSALTKKNPPLQNLEKINAILLIENTNDETGNKKKPFMTDVIVGKRPNLYIKLY